LSWHDPHAEGHAVSSVSRSTAAPLSSPAASQAAGGCAPWIWQTQLSLKEMASRTVHARMGFATDWTSGSTISLSQRYDLLGDDIGAKDNREAIARLDSLLQTAF
jgi:hypothetical protein